jgi:ABC-2 type transport system ATP-binding protein
VTPPSPPPLLELDELEVRLAGRPILKGLRGSLTGQVVGLLGPNGAGKTTLFNTILGFYPPSAGAARVLGRDVVTEAESLRGRIGYMPESESFISGMSAVRFVRMMAELAGLPPKPALERAHEALFYVGLGEARYRKLETYSLGMKQLAKLAQAIAHGPELLLLDEPTNGLDPSARQRMLSLVREIAASGVRVILSSHLLRDVESCCDSVIVLKDGKVATIADLAAERAGDRRYLEIETRAAAAGPAAADGGANGADGFSRALAELGCEVAELPNRKLKVVLPASVDVRALYRVAGEQGIQLRRLISSRNSLEHLFLKAMEEGSAAGARGDQRAGL